MPKLIIRLAPGFPSRKRDGGPLPAEPAGACRPRAWSLLSPGLELGAYKEGGSSCAIAERFTAELRRKCAELAAAPIRMGRARNELRPGLCSHPHKSYVVFFRYIGDALEIVDVIEGHRYIPALFRGGEEM